MVQCFSLHLLVIHTSEKLNGQLGFNSTSSWESDGLWKRWAEHESYYRKGRWVEESEAVSEMAIKPKCTFSLSIATVTAGTLKHVEWLGMWPAQGCSSIMWLASQGNKHTFSFWAFCNSVLYLLHPEWKMFSLFIKAVIYNHGNFTPWSIIGHWA